jgi:hypothetical protein
VNWNKPFLLAFLIGALPIFGQGTFVYDQQSATETNITEGGGGIQSAQPVGQSFTPSLSAVGFVRFQLYDSNFGNSLGANIFVNIRSGSILGPIIGVSSVVSLPDNFGGYSDFIFSTPASVTPGTIYYFQPVVQSGDVWGIGGSSPLQYAGGTAFFNGAPDLSHDLWFREGIMAVPEPTTISLATLGLGTLACLRYTKTRRQKITS